MNTGGSDRIMYAIVVYSSPLGRTKRIAEAVASGLPEGTPCVSVQALPDDLLSYDCVFLGCCMEGNVVEDSMKQVLQNLKNKRIALFITVESGPFSDDSSKLLRSAIEQLPPGVQVEGTYITPTADGVNPTAEDSEERLAFARTFAENTMSRLRSMA